MGPPSSPLSTGGGEGGEDETGGGVTTASHRVDVLLVRSDHCRRRAALVAPVKVSQPHIDGRWPIGASIAVVVAALVDLPPNERS